MSDAFSSVPANYEAEEAVIGSLLLDNEVLSDVATVLTARDFHRERHTTIYQAIVDLWQAGAPIDVVTLATRLDQQGVLADCGGQSYLISLLNKTPTAAHASHYARLVREAAERRRIINAAGRIAELAYKATPEDAIAQGVALLDATRTNSATGFLSWDESFDFWSNAQLERAVDYAANKPQLTLPWSNLNFVRPLRAGTLATIAAASAVGKTAFAENMAEFWARRGFQVLFAHFELSHQVMLDRRAARWSGEPMHIIERGELTTKMQKADDEIKRWPGKIHYQECFGWSIGQLLAAARQRRHAGECDVLIVDYFNKIALEIPPGANITTARGLAVEALKNFAERAAIPVVMLAQLSKDGKQQERKTAVFIRDTGEIEDKSNLVITLNRPLLDNALQFGNHTIAAGKHSPHTKVRVDKQTMGDTGEIDLIFVGERFMFVQAHTMQG